MQSKQKINEAHQRNQAVKAPSSTTAKPPLVRSKNNMNHINSIMKASKPPLTRGIVEMYRKP